RGYGYPGVRGWLERHHIEPVIPTRKDQPRAEGFDKATYRRRNIIERAIGWFKWCRALATRFDKLAVNYVALWIVANIQYLLREYPEALGIQLSETTYWGSRRTWPSRRSAWRTYPIACAAGPTAGWTWRRWSASRRRGGRGSAAAGWRWTAWAASACSSSAPCWSNSGRWRRRPGWASSTRRRCAGRRGRPASCWPAARTPSPPPSP